MIQLPTLDNSWLPMFGSGVSLPTPHRRLGGISPVRHSSAADALTASGAVISIRPVAPSAAQPPKRPSCEEPDPADAYGLTPAEREVLWLLADGLSNKEIALRRKSSVGTVKVHLVRIYPKLGVGNRTEAARVGQRLRELDIWRRHPDPDPLRRWLTLATSETRGAGETLFQAGDAADALYYIQDGQVEFPELRASLAKGAVFGEIGVFSPSGKRTATARCSTRTLLFRLGAPQAQRLYLSDPMFARHVMELVSQRITEARLSQAA